MAEPWVSPYALIRSGLGNDQALMLMAVRLEIEATGRDKLEAMCERIGFDHEGKSDAVLRRTLTALAGTAGR